MVVFEIGSNKILVDPMKNRTERQIVRAYQTLVDRLKDKGIFPKLHILDNESSEEMKVVIKKNNTEYQLVPPTKYS